MNVLVVFANPRGTDALRLGEEDRVIQQCVQRSKHRDRITLSIKHAVTVDDVRRALLDGTYDMIHFSGHGTGNGLAFEGKNGRMYVPPRDALADLLAEFSPPLTCALLNACYSVSQSEFTSVGVPYTIAMQGPISDEGAILFTEGFYDSLGAGKDVEFSFRQGVHALRLAGHPDSTAPKLVRKGEMVDLRNSGQHVRATSASNCPDVGQTVLLGIGVDVSGSMETNINNRVGAKQTRLEGFRDALDGAVNTARASLERIRANPLPARVFAYAFGLRTGDVCDLFSLIKAADGVISPSEIEDMKERYSRQMRQRYSGYGGLGDLARSYGFGGLVSSVENSVRANAEQEVRAQILAEIQKRLSARLERIGDLTLGLHELADLWRDSSGRLGDSEGLIFGNTPMCEALRKIEDRFRRELAAVQAQDYLPTLLLLSDGEPTDGDPEPIAERIRAIGVHVICCFITSEDIAEPRTLPNKPRPDWPASAQRMFRMASQVDDASPFVRYLLAEGWAIDPHAHSFVQANHSETLRELVDFALSPLENEAMLLPKGI